MADARKKICAAELREFLSYDPETGEFTWNVNRGGGARAGEIAGNKDVRGYIRIKINFRLYLAHRLAWIFITGSHPENEIDHINGDKSDNRWVNLRAATRSENMRNRNTYKNNKSGIKGVCWKSSESKWQAQIKVDGKNKYLGLFGTVEEARSAYCKAASDLHGEFKNLG